MIRERIVLRFWQAAGDLLKLAAAGDLWWDQVQAWLDQVLAQIDPDTADIRMVELLGWQRHVSRFAAESDELFRLRVKYALPNAQDSGSIAGFLEIFERLELGAVEQQERTDPVNWDVITLTVSDAVFGTNQELFERIIRKYGRTCRRYTFATSTPVEITLRTFDFDCTTLHSGAA